MAGLCEGGNEPPGSLKASEFIYTTHATRALQGRDLSGEELIYGSHTYFLTTQGHGGPPRMRDQLNAMTTSDTTQHLRHYTAFTHIYERIKQFNVSPTTVHRVLHKQLRLYPYKVRIVQQLKPNDRPRRKEFVMEILDRIDTNPHFLDNVLFSDEATFHV
ncbi:hypothetical protein ANN_21203 [Periplaneta americana]|uniref:Transposase Tc1-like domain-containing protein n=1 Tax=Periplaneta americana TaxID=6978 RepID=A0ABQ8SET3_PERAM|nr:hypothetical protein ANN_21203 [Periplaneta americana]